MDHLSSDDCRCDSNGPMEGRRGHAGRRAIGRRKDAKMCVLAVENRKTFIVAAAADDDVEFSTDAPELLVQGALMIVRMS